jgi:hypothetical protein
MDLLETRPLDPASRRQAAFDLLRVGRYEEGWRLYESRRDVPGLGMPTHAGAAYPEWLGEDLKGKRLAVCAEQGFGDQLMFGRYLSRLRERGAEVMILCDPRAVARTFEAAGYLTRPLFNDRPLPQADCWTFFGSLPYRLGLGPPPQAEYLSFALSSGGGVGVMTAGNPLHPNDAHRSLSPDQAAELLRLGRDLSPASTGALDFLDTAEIVAALDLVITVDSAVAHLAGAMGKACWVLLPWKGLDWRWADGIRSPWYPSMRLFRQPKPGDWRSVLEAVRTAF